MAARISFGWLCASLIASVASPVLAVTDADRIAVYKEFRANFDARKFADAQPLAEKLVALTEQQYGGEELQLTTPLANLATVQYKLGNYPAAIETYQRTLRILQAKSTITDKQQIRPLHGLGVSFLAANDPESAVVALKRAADLSRNTDGLFNINQVEFIDALVDAYASTGRFVEAEKESTYALRVEEAAFGRGSIKLLGRLEKLALWYESDRRFSTERVVHERALTILTRASTATDLRRVGPLRGIARSYRLESYYGVEGADTNTTFNNGGGSNGAPVFTDGSQQRRGEAALATALDIIDANNPVNQQMRGAVLTDLGDWYLTAASSRRAFDKYAEAWKALTLANNTQPLEIPRLLAYRPSISSVDRSQLDPAESIVKTVEMHFRVDRDGRLDGITSPTTDVPDVIVRNCISSMRRARFAPRIENGLAVPTDNVVYVEKVLIKVTSPDSETSSGKAAAKPAPDPTPAEPAAESPPPAGR